MEIQPTREIVQSNPGSGYRSIALAVRSGDLTRLRRGAVREAGDLRPDERLLLEISATALVINHGTWFSHRSAALIHSLPVLIFRETRPEVIRTFGGHGGRSARLHARAGALGPQERLWLNGLPVTSRDRTVLDLVRELPFQQSLAVVDAALRAGADRTELLAAVQPGRGCRLAQRALEAGDPLSESAGESESRAVMICAGLPLPELQVPIYDAHGFFIARPDFLWLGKRLIGEYDGEGKYQGQFGISPADAIKAERARQQALEAEGFHVFRWGKEVLRKPGELARLVRRELASRPWL